MTNARILIVEDEAITVSALKRELASLGYQVAATASTADKALNAVEYISQIWFLWTSLLLEPSMASLPRSPSAATSICRSPFSPLTRMTEQWSVRWPPAPLGTCSSHLADRD